MVQYSRAMYVLAVFTGSLPGNKSTTWLATTIQKENYNNNRLTAFYTMSFILDTLNYMPCM